MFSKDNVTPVAMKNRLLKRAGLLSLAVVFSIALMFAFTELPRLLDQLLQNQFGFPQFDQGAGEVNRLKTEMFISGLHLRWIGYGSLILILALIAIGYATKKPGWAVAGACLLYTSPSPRDRTRSRMPSSA